MLRKYWTTVETCPAGSWRDLTVNVFVCTISTRCTKLSLLCSCKPSVVLKLRHVYSEANLNSVYFRGVCTAEIHSTVVPFRGEARYHFNGYVKGLSTLFSILVKCHVKLRVCVYAFMCVMNANRVYWANPPPPTRHLTFLLICNTNFDAKF